MNCKKCRVILQENEQFCRICGTPVNENNNINNNPIMDLFESHQQSQNSINDYQQ